MKSLFLSLAFSLSLSFLEARAQVDVKPLPKAALTAKTIAIVNNTHSDAISEGAVEALKRWGKFAMVDDSDAADITLTFEKKSEHAGTSTQKANEDGQVDTGYSMSFSSTVRMRATLKGADTSFYFTSTSDSKKKAGSNCILDLQRTYLTSPR